MTSRRALGALTALGLALVTALAAVPPAHAAGPPVTAPDVATVYQGNVVTVLPLANDTDPDNDLLTVCRLGTENYQGITVDHAGAEVDLTVSEKVAPGSYVFTYYTCDFTTLVPGTITLTVQDLPDLKVTKAGPGKIKVKNTLDFRIRFVYGSFKEDGPDGQVKLAPGKSRTIQVSRSRVDWACDAKQGAVFCGSGHVKGVRLTGTS